MFEGIVVSILLWFGMYLLVTLSLNIEYGYGGIPNFGLALAVLMGAITVGGIVNRVIISIFSVNAITFTAASGFAKSAMDELISSNPMYGIALLILILVISALIGGTVGAVFILPSAKLRSDYLAITLLAISEVMFMIVYYNTDIVGGYYGAPTPNILAFIPGEDRDVVFTILILLIAFIIFIFVERLINSPYGRLLRAMREDEDVMRSFGKDIMKIRIKTMAIGSAIASIGGALYSLYAGNVIGIINLSARINWTFFPFLMVLLGGMGNNKGVTLGTLTFVTIWRLIDIYKHEIAKTFNLPFDVNWLQYIIFGVLMIIILYYRPEGILKEKPIKTEPIKEFENKVKSSKPA